jgi:hypothetical protein
MPLVGWLASMNDFNLSAFNTMFDPDGAELLKIPVV